MQIKTAAGMFTDLNMSSTTFQQEEQRLYTSLTLNFLPMGVCALGTAGLAEPWGGGTVAEPGSSDGFG